MPHARNTRLEAGANLGIGRLTHPPPQGIAEEVAFIIDGPSLKAAFASKGDGFERFRPPHCRGRVLIVALLPCSRFRDDSVGLVAELDGEPAVRGKHLDRRMNLFAVTRGVIGDLRGFVATEAVALKVVG